MKINIRALAFGCAILWGGSVMAMGLLNLMYPSYGQQFLGLLASFYPGYHAAQSITQVILVSFYAIVDGLIGGALLGWLYNQLNKRPIEKTHAQ